jgi:hypothetical protein
MILLHENKTGQELSGRELILSQIPEGKEGQMSMGEMIIF